VRHTEVIDVITVAGTRLCGKVSRVPGSFYIATLFHHWCFLPLVPVCTFVIAVGSERSDGFFGGTFNGHRIRTRWDSVLAGYVRWWCGAILVVTTCFACLDVGEFLNVYLNKRVPAWVPRVLSLVCLVPLVAVSMALPGRFGYWLQAAFHLLSVVAGVVYYSAVSARPELAEIKAGLVLPVPVLVVPNVTLLLYGLFRWFDFATPEQAAEMAAEAGFRTQHPVVPTSGEGWELAENHQGS
ncbi:hypothetical protein R5W23_006293, partial [Gemmata sp. JC673]